MLLSVIVPVYREERNIPEFLRRLRAVLAGVSEDYEVIFSMDPSPDRTEEVIRQMSAIALKVPGRRGAISFNVRSWKTT